VPLSHFCRCKEKDAALCEKPQQLIARFITIEALRELGHSPGTNANESFDQIISWMAPKNKVHSMSISFKMRVGMAIRINTLGLVGCHREVFDKLGMFVTSDVCHHLQVKDTNRHKGVTKAKTPAAKCQSVVGMDEGHMEEDTTVATAPRRMRGPRRCGLC